MTSNASDAIGKPVRRSRCGQAGMAMGVGFLFLLALVVSGCAGGAGGAVKQMAVAAVEPVGHRIVIARRYEHEVKTPQGPVRQVVEYGWDYTDAVVIERTTSLSGELVAFRTVPGQILRATDAELQEAYRLFQADEELRPTLDRDGVHFEGGFIHMKLDDPHCHIRSRCIYVFATLDQGRNKIAQAIVDLQTQRVVYPHFDPGLVGPGN